MLIVAALMHFASLGSVWRMALSTRAIHGLCANENDGETRLAAISAAAITAFSVLSKAASISLVATERLTN